MALCICTASSSVLAEEVFFCVDTAVSGFSWERGDAKPSKFTPERHTIKVVSDTERLILRMGDPSESPAQYECKRPYAIEAKKEEILCDDGYGEVPWIFYKNTYVRAFLAGPPSGGRDPNILVAYGTCTKF